MAIKPILFNTEMVKAILDGRKTQTRRLVKGLPLAEPYFTVEDGKPFMCDENGDWYPAECFSRVQPDDILWVRETWAKDAGRYMYRANYSDNEKFFMNGREIRMTWRPSIHMPREAARLFLQVKNVRAERLQSMMPEECARDGCFAPEAIEAVGVTALFKPLWDSTIRKDKLSRYGWAADPYVWVYEFKRVPKPQGWQEG